jgi:hypothetical protein
LHEALAAADHDFILSGPASKLKHLREKVLAAKKHGVKHKLRQGRRYFPMLAAGFFVATAAVILLNALLWQKTRHPAPLFSRPAPVTAAKKPGNSDTVAGSAARRTAPASPLMEAPGSEAEAPGMQKPAGGEPRPARPATSSGTKPSGNASSVRPRDPISQLLQATPTPQPGTPATSKAAKPGAAKPGNLVVATQRALVKLGFVLESDGVAGAATRQAIKRYQQDHALPADGNITPALMRRLSAEANIPIQ